LFVHFLSCISISGERVALFVRISSIDLSRKDNAHIFAGLRELKDTEPFSCNPEHLQRVSATASRGVAGVLFDQQ
jgi:hypothetical protein